MIVLTTRKQHLWRVVFSPDGCRLAASGDRGSYFWPNLANPGEMRRVGDSLNLAEAPSHGFGFTHDGEFLIGSRMMEGILALHLRTERYTSVRTPGKALHVAISPTEPLILVSNTSIGWVSAWGVSDKGTFDQVWSIEPDDHYCVGQVTFSADGSWFLYPSGKRLYLDAFTVTLRRTRTGELIDRFPSFGHASADPATSPDGDSIVYRCLHELSIFRLPTPYDLPIRIWNDSTKHFTGIAFHPSGRYLAATSNDATVKLYDTATWQLVHIFAWEIGRLRCVAFSPDGTLAAVGNDTGTIVVWDVDL